MKTFYRVCNSDTQQGLWYNYQGEHVGLIHGKFNFCVNAELPMPFDDELVGWLSAVENLNDLWAWFTQEDIRELQKHGWYIHAYEVENYKFYDKFQHYIICQKTSKCKQKIKL